MDIPLRYPRTLHWPWSETVHRDDTVHPDPEKFVGVPVVITEKLDGGNTCLYRGEVYARSVAGPSRAGWMSMVRKHHAWRTHDTDVMFYGEDLFGIHSIEYEAMKESETYRLFATRFYCEVLKEDTFHEWDTTAWFADIFLGGVQTVPVLFRGTFKSVDEITQWFKTHLSEPSSIGGEREGFVIRWADRFPAHEFSTKVAKYVRANHVQTDEHWTRNWQQCKLIEETSGD